MIEKGIVERVSAVGVMGNVLLVVFKLFAGFVGRSSAMVSDAIHSLSDVLATFVAYLGVTFSEAPEDKEHPYGHEQIENLAAIAIALTLLATGGALCYHGVIKTCLCYHAMTSSESNLASPEIPTLLPLVAAIVSIVAKEAMFWYTLYYANRLDSAAFRADAWHHRTDAFSSVGSLIGVAGARMGFPILDPLASIVISVFILHVAIGILRRSASQAVDTACDDKFEEEIRACILANKSVEHLDLIRTRQFGNRVYVEAEIAVDGNATLFVAHRIAHEVHNAVEERFPCVKHVMVHVNPAQLDDTDASLTRVKPASVVGCDDSSSNDG